MVVVSGTWVKNVSPFPPSANEEEAADNLDPETDRVVAKAMLICRPNSHHFQQRTLFLDEPVKVGRSVARAKPASNNAIFDCKVLSRHHAVVWYENGKFFLEDTKSSNGTFVNNNKLGDEKHEVSSGDIVQFGVDVIENNRKVTHGCIIATLKLYMPDGKEAKASPSISEGPRHGMVPLDDLYRLNEIIQEATQREQCLETKLRALQHIVEETRKSAEASWQAYVGEERLLSRVSALETQLQQANKNWSQDMLKEEIAKLKESNEQYQEAAKLALEKVHSEKLEAVNLAIEQERAKISAQQDSMLAKDQLTQAHNEIQEIAQRLTKLSSQREEEKAEYDKQVRHMEGYIQKQEERIIELEATLFHITKEEQERNDRPQIIPADDFKTKEQNILENESYVDYLENSINLVVAPVQESQNDEQSEFVKKDEEKDEEKENKRVSFILPEKECAVKTGDSPTSINFEDRPEKDDEIDSKTLKYQYQSAQREQHQLRLKVHQLEDILHLNQAKIQDLEVLLAQEKNLSSERLASNETLQQKLLACDQRCSESSLQNGLLTERVADLLNQLETHKELTKKYEKKLQDLHGKHEEDDRICEEKDFENHQVSEQQYLEVKEKHGDLIREKEKLQQELAHMTSQYHQALDRIQNKFFFYIAPLIFLIFYLIIHTYFS